MIVVKDTVMAGAAAFNSVALVLSAPVDLKTFYLAVVKNIRVKFARVLGDRNASKC